MTSYIICLACLEVEKQIIIAANNMITPASGSTSPLVVETLSITNPASPLNTTINTPTPLNHASPIITSDPSAHQRT
jgi:hypothetical protein